MGPRVALLSLFAVWSHRAVVRADDALNGAVSDAFGESSSVLRFFFGVRTATYSRVPPLLKVER